MRKWFIDKLLPALLMGLLVAAINTYIDVQMMKKELQSMRAELTDLWSQANDQLQKR